jgi:hypothetical protein
LPETNNASGPEWRGCFFIINIFIKNIHILYKYVRIDACLPACLLAKKDSSETIM